MADDKKLASTIAGIQDGTLATSLRKNMRYTATGIIVGTAVGIVGAALMGKCRLCFGIGGAVIGGAIGRLVVPAGKDLHADGGKDKYLNCCI